MAHYLVKLDIMDHLQQVLTETRGQQACFPFLGTEQCDKCGLVLEKGKRCKPCRNEAARACFTEKPETVERRLRSRPETKPCKKCGLDRKNGKKCKPCHAEAMSVRYAADRERLKADQRAYTAANREAVNARAVAARAANPEKNRAQERARRAADPEKYRARLRARYAANPEKYRAWMTAYRDANRESVNERQLALRIANPERYRAYEQKHREANLESIRAEQRAYNARNRHKRSAYGNAYREANPDKLAVHNNARRARVIDCGGSFTSAELQAVFDRQQNRCANPYCNMDGTMTELGHLTVEHDIPLKRGGSNSISNIIGTCRSCNCSKKTKTMSEWVASGLAEEFVRFREQYGMAPTTYIKQRQKAKPTKPRIDYAALKIAIAEHMRKYPGQSDCAIALHFKCSRGPVRAAKSQKPE